MQNLLKAQRTWLCRHAHPIIIFHLGGVIHIHCHCINFHRLVAMSKGVLHGPRVTLDFFQRQQQPHHLSSRFPLGNSLHHARSEFAILHPISTRQLWLLDYILQELKGTLNIVIMEHVRRWGLTFTFQVENTAKMTGIKNEGNIIQFKSVDGSWKQQTTAQAMIIIYLHEAQDNQLDPI